MKYKTITMIENRIIFPQMISAKSESKFIEHQSVMWITQHMDSKSGSYI